MNAVSHAALKRTLTVNQLVDMEWKFGGTTKNEFLNFDMYVYLHYCYKFGSIISLLALYPFHLTHISTFLFINSLSVLLVVQCTKLCTILVVFSVNKVIF